MHLILSLFATTVIEYHDGQCILKKGKCLQWQLDEIATLLVAHGCLRGAIYLNTIRTVSFSSTIPANAHQRIRNILHS
jgi:hypothetical protein